MSEDEEVIVLDADEIEFLKFSQAKQLELIQAFNACNQKDESSPHEAIRTVVDRMTRTMKSIEHKEAELSDLKKYKVRFVITKTPMNEPLDVNIRLDQLRTSKPLEKNQFIVIKTPLGPSLTTPRIVAANTCVNYTHSFTLPDRSQRSVAMMKASDVEFSIFQYITEFDKKIGKGRVEFVASAVAPLMPLCFSSMTFTPLEFKNNKGEKTNYVFETTMSTKEMLIPENDEIIIDEILELLPE